MFGWIHESMRQMVIRKYGADVWAKVMNTINSTDEVECDVNIFYPDERTFTIVNTVIKIIGICKNDLWETYGTFLVQYAMENGWDELLRSLSPDFQGFLESLNSLHYFINHVVFRTQLRGPSFRCETVGINGSSILLHYYSTRSDVYPIVIGAVREIARQIFHIEIIVEIQSKNSEQRETYSCEHVTFHISQSEKTMLSAFRLTTSQRDNLIVTNDEYPIRLVDFCCAFPHHLCFDKDLRLLHVGVQIQATFKEIILGETLLGEVIELCHPQIQFNYESLHAFRNSVFICRLKDSRRRSENAPKITLKGSMHSLDGGKYLCFMCSLNVTTLHELIERELFLSDIQLHDNTRDLIMLNQSHISQVQLNERLEETMRSLNQLATQIEKEKNRTEELLCELMPRSVADNLRRGHTVEAAEFSEVTVLFSDIVTFTNICSSCTPYDVVNMLNDLYIRFDRLVGLHNVYKVETIGDAYMIAGGVPEESEAHCERILNTALGMIAESHRVFSPVTRQPLNIRIGVHAGPVITGVVGVKMPRYCLFGHTIYIANQMESSSVPNHIHVTNKVVELALKTNSAFTFTARGLIELKGCSPMETSFLERNEKLTSAQICGRKIEDNSWVSDCNGNVAIKVL